MGARMKNYTLEELHNAVKEILKLKLNSDITKKILDTLIWKITEINGKYEGVPNWSKKALELKGHKKEYSKELRHDHVHTREKIIKDFLNNSINSECTLGKIEARIVTKGEHDSLNKVSKEVEGWERYKATGIE